MTVDLEFLIQKEGDFSWLPLESLTIEILVGRYQLIAQASEADCPIQVHIHHQYVQDDIWQEEFQQKLLRTDSQGRIEVLPPTLLQHGRWIISCAPNEHEQLAQAQIDRHCVQLQVLEQDLDLDQEWEFIDPPLETHPDVQAADLLTPTADITSNTAWNNLISTEHNIPDLEPLFNTPENHPAAEIKLTSVESSSSTLETAEGLGNPEQTPAETMEPLVAPSTSPSQTQKIESEPILPKLPIIPKDVPPIRLQISPGIVLPPALFKPDLTGDDPPKPQLPVFPHLDHWQDLSYKDLSIALGRLHWSKLDTHGKAIDLDFQSLELRERFLKTLHGLALPKTLPPITSHSPLSH